MRLAYSNRLCAALALLAAVACSDSSTGDDSGVARVEVTPPALSVRAFERGALSASVLGPSGATIAGRRVVWSVQDTTIATVSQLGEVAGVRVGTTFVTASSGGKNSEFVPVTVTAPAIQSVRVTPQSSTVRVGANVTLSVTVLDTRGGVITGAPIAWASTIPGIATLSNTSSSGATVTAVAAGATTITATVGGTFGFSGLIVQNIPVASVTLSPLSDTLVVGDTLQLTATARDSAGATLTGRPVIWRSTAPNVASVSATGRVVAAGVGTAFVYGIIDNKNGETYIAVTPAPVASITLFPSAATITAGRSGPLFAQLRDARGNVLTGRAVSWTSDNPSVATVSATGVVSALTAGTAAITATSEGRSNTSVITVSTTPVASLQLTPTSSSIVAGTTQRYTATARDAAGNILPNRFITWITGAPSVATIDVTGLATGVGAGTVLIIATCEGLNATATLVVSAPSGG